MSQNARVALWVPTATPPDAASDIIQTNGLPDSIKRIPTLFALAGTGGGGGGIPEAPIDGEQYARKNATWEIVAVPSGGIAEAPTDGKPYVRQNSAWAAFDIIDAGTF